MDLEISTPDLVLLLNFETSMEGRDKMFILVQTETLRANSSVFADMLDIGNTAQNGQMALPDPYGSLPLVPLPGDDQGGMSTLMQVLHFDHGSPADLHRQTIPTLQAMILADKYNVRSSIRDWLRRIVL